MRLKLQNKKKIRQSLFGNYYSALNYLSNDTQYVIFFSFKIFEKFSKKILKLNEKNQKVNNFIYCTPFEGEFNVE